MRTHQRYITLTVLYILALQLHAQITLTGVVHLQRTGQPLPGVMVNLKQEGSKRILKFTRTQADGSYQVADYYTTCRQRTAILLDGLLHRNTLTFGRADTIRHDDDRKVYRTERSHSESSKHSPAWRHTCLQRGKFCRHQRQVVGRRFEENARDRGVGKWRDKTQWQASK